MSDKAIVISWDAVKAIGYTVKDTAGDVSIRFGIEILPENCAVVFVELEEWNNARKQAKV
jgi:hypothetical protein